MIERGGTETVLVTGPVEVSFQYEVLAGLEAPGAGQVYDATLTEGVFTQPEAAPGPDLVEFNEQFVDAADMPEVEDVAVEVS